MLGPRDTEAMREALAKVDNASALPRLQSGSCTKQDFQNITTVLENHDQAIRELERIYEIVNPTTVP